MLVFILNIIKNQSLNKNTKILFIKEYIIKILLKYLMKYLINYVYTQKNYIILMLIVIPNYNITKFYI